MINDLLRRYRTLRKELSFSPNFYELLVDGKNAKFTINNMFEFKFIVW